MPKLTPIHAVTYNTASNRDLSTRITPPYDVLDEQRKQTLLARDPHNIVAIDLPVTPPKTVGPDAAYRQAACCLQQWMDQGVLIRDETPAVFAYQQSFWWQDQQQCRRGLFCALKSEPFNQPHGIFRHERTIQGGLDDRYKLMAATNAQLSPVFGIYRDRRARVADLLSGIWQRPADFGGQTPEDRVEHQLWRITDQSILADLQRFFAGNEVYIADGHHRYHTAQRFGQDYPQQPGTDACLFMLVAAEDTGLVVLPTHRAIVGPAEFGIESLRRQLPESVSITPINDSHLDLSALAKTLSARGHHAMGLCKSNCRQNFVLTTSGADPLAACQAAGSKVRRQLDVTILHELILNHLTEPAPTDHYRYTADLNELRQIVDAAPGRIGFVLQPAPLESVMAVSQAHELMPPKSTFFYPKVATGFVIHCFG